MEMPDMRRNLIGLLDGLPCSGPNESVASCPDRKYGSCREVEDLSYCAIQNLANHLIANGVMIQQWIPVTERLPEPEKRVLILTKVKGWNGKEYHEIMCGFYEDGNVWCEDSKDTWDWEMMLEENYDESRDDYRVPEGWFEELLNHIDDYNCVAIGDVVTHWMPLPEPPEEVR